MKSVRYITIAGNSIYILWMLYNGIDEGFNAGIVPLVAIIGLTCLLALNIILLWRQR